MENCTPIGGVFLWNIPNEIDLEDGKRRGDERASCVAQLHLFRICLLIMEGLSLADKRFLWGSLDLGNLF